jgi:hypothetical protein
MLDYDEYGISLADKSFYKDIALNSFERQTGLMLSTAATRISTVSAGSAWFGVKLFSLAENKAGISGELYEYYLTAGVWGSQLVTAYDSTYYSDGTDRQSLGVSKYDAKYFYRGIEVDNHAYYIHGDQKNSLADALAEAVPVAPEVVTAHSLYVGKIVIQQNATNGVAYPRTWGQTVSVSGATNHEDLSGILQAGTGVLNGHISNGTQTIAGAKTFSDLFTISANGGSNSMEIRNKAYLNKLTTAFLHSTNWAANTDGSLFKLYDGTDTEKIRFDSRTGQNSYIMGNVGIGTPTPVAKTTIQDITADADGALGSMSPQQIIIGGTANQNNRMEFGVDNSGADALSFIQCRNTVTGAEPLLLNPAGGNVGIGTASPDVALDVNGYTQLGTDAPKIKMKKLTGTTPSTQGAYVGVSHGLTQSKILSVELIIDNAFPSNYTYDAGRQGECSLAADVIYVYTHRTNSGNILSKPFRLLITYEE